MKYNQAVYDIYDQMFEPDRKPCMNFLRKLNKQRGYRINYFKVMRESGVNEEDLRRWLNCLVRMGLVENSSRLCVNKIGMGRFENQTCAQRRANSQFTPRALYLINQQLYHPLLDRVYINSDKTLRDRTDKVFANLKDIHVLQSYVTGLLLFAKKHERTYDELNLKFSRSNGDLPRVLKAMYAQGLLEADDGYGKFVADSGRLQKEIFLIADESNRNHKRLMSQELRDIVAQQVFRGYTKSAKNFKKVQI